MTTAIAGTRLSQFRYTSEVVDHKRQAQLLREFAAGLAEEGEGLRRT